MLDRADTYTARFISYRMDRCCTNKGAAGCASTRQRQRERPFLSPAYVARGWRPATGGIILSGCRECPVSLTYTARRVSYVYGLADPQTGRLHYVGKADDPAERFRSHLSSGRHRKTGRHPVHEWLKALDAAGLTPRLRALACVSRLCVHDREIEAIREALDAGEPLTNVRHVPTHRPDAG